MANNYREIMESIDAILDETEVDGADEVLSPQELLKDIVGSLRHCIDKMSSEEVDDYEDFVEKLKKVRDILQQDEYTDEHQLDNEEEIVEDGSDYGAEGMGPRIDKNEKQHYENPKGQSYAARHGFVGI